MKRLLPPFLFFISIALMLALDYQMPVTDLITAPATHLGLLLLLAGAVLTVRSARLFSRVGTNINTFRNPEKLVTNGPFGISRNPMYLGFATALLGIAIMLGSASPFAIMALFILITDLWYIRFEEARMTEIFGQEFETYKRRTRRWI